MIDKHLVATAPANALLDKAFNEPTMPWLIQRLRCIALMAGTQV
jgi:hypothetical protein